MAQLVFVCLVIVRFAAEFDFRTFDPEGVVLYAESSQDSWFMLGLRAGRIEVQFKNQHTFKVTSGGKAINDGQWHVVRKHLYIHSGSWSANCCIELTEINVLILCVTRRSLWMNWTTASMSRSARKLWWASTALRVSLFQLMAYWRPKSTSLVCPTALTTSSNL